MEVLQNSVGRHNICHEFTTADSAKFNGVAERHIAILES